MTAFLSLLAIFVYVTGSYCNSWAVGLYSREIELYNDRIALEFDRHLGNAPVDVSVKFQSDWESLNPNLAASILHEVLR